MTDAQSLDGDVGNKETLETRKRNGSEVFGNSTQANLYEKITGPDYGAVVWLASQGNCKGHKLQMITLTDYS